MKNVQLGALNHIVYSSSRQAGQCQGVQEGRVSPRSLWLCERGGRSSRVLSRERYYTGLRDDAGLRIKLSGNFEGVVGEQDTFCAFVSFSDSRVLLTLARPHLGIRESLRL